MARDDGSGADRRRPGHATSRRARRPGCARRTQPRAVAAPPSASQPPGALAPRAIIAGVVIVVLAIGAIYLVSRNVYFVGTNNEGLFTLYRGLPYDLPLGVRLYSQRYVSGVPALSVPAARRKRVLDHQLRSQGDASDLIKSLEPIGRRPDVGPQPRALRTDPGQPAGDRRLHGRPAHARLERARRDAHLRRDLPRLLRLRPSVHPLAPAKRGPVPVPDRGALLASVGLVELYRIQESFAIKQAGWFALGLVFFCLTIVFLRDYRMLERYRYTIAAGSIVLLLLPRVPGQRRPTAPTWRSTSARSRSSPRSSPRSAMIIFLASYLRDVREVLVQGRLPRISLKHMGPLLVIWGASMIMLDLHPRPRLVADVLRRLPGAASTSRRAACRSSIGGLGAVPRSVPYFLASHIAHVHSRVEIWQHPFQSGAWSRARATRSRRACSRRPTAGCSGRGFSQSLLYLPGGHSILPAPHTDLIYAVIVNELGLFGAAGAARRLPAVHPPRLQDGDDLRRRLRQAARHRADGGVRAAGVRDRRRRHAR